MNSEIVQILKKTLTKMSTNNKNDFIDTLTTKIIRQLKNNEEIKWLIFIKRQSPWEREFKKALIKLFEGQRKEVLGNMANKPRAFRGINPLTGAELNVKGWEEDWLFNEKLWIARFGKEGKKFIGGVVEAVGQSVIGDLEAGVDFDVSRPAVVNFNKKFVDKYSKEVNKATVKQLKRTLKEGIAAGESIPDLRKRVTKVFDSASRQRSLMIARTETIRASNFATDQAYLQSGVVEAKEWLTAFDERTCEIGCKELHGRKTGLGKPFGDKGVTANLDYTDGEIPNPPLHPMCRCTLVPVLIE